MTFSVLKRHVNVKSKKNRHNERSKTIENILNYLINNAV